MIDAAHDRRGLHGDDAMLDALRRAAGDDAVEQPHPGEWSVHGASARAIVSPPEADAVAAVLALCSAEGWSVEPAGAGTWLDHGRAPARAADIILSTRRLSARLQSEPADLVVGVDAGVSFDVLQQRLAVDGQELTLDPPHHPDATIGATIALAAAGPLRASAGTPRDHVLGIDVMSGDGRLLHFGGRVVKNVAGYDAVRLLTGSRGTLGVITGLWLRVRALPAGEHSFALAGELPALLQVVAGLNDVNAAAAELLGPATAAAVGLPRTWTLLLRLRGGRAEIAAGAERIGVLTAGLEAGEIAGAAWAGLARVEGAAQPLVRVAGLGAELAAGLERCLTFISASGNTLDDWHVAAHARNGIVRLWPAESMAAAGMGVHGAPVDPSESAGGPPDERAVDSSRPAAALADLRTETEAAGGTVLLECASRSLQAIVAARTPSTEVKQRLETGLARVFDPAGILAPGRWP